MEKQPTGGLVKHSLLNDWCNDVIPTNSKECSDLDAKQCEYRSDCFSIRAQKCGSIVGEDEFIECIPKHDAIPCM